MVFHEIERIADVINGQRIILYYIDGKFSTGNVELNHSKLHKILDIAFEMLEKKNDDLLIVKIIYGSEHFKDFQDLYKPEVTGIVTLFVVNNEGIPLLCKQLNVVEDVPDVTESLCLFCRLNCVPKHDIIKLVNDNQSDTKQQPTNIVLGHDTKSECSSSSVQPLRKSNPQSIASDSDVLGATSKMGNSLLESNQLLSTELQIRLPDGKRDVQKFKKDACLQEIWVFIATKFNIKNFDLKTYDHQNFTEDEYEMTLHNLGLSPNGVIIVVLKNVIPFNNYKGIGGTITNGVHQLRSKSLLLYCYIQNIFLMFWNFVFGNNNARRIQSPEGNSNEDAKKGSKKPTPMKKFGNIHTLRQHEDSDDENNRYNGNSTQQK